MDSQGSAEPGHVLSYARAFAGHKTIFEVGDCFKTQKTDSWPGGYKLSSCSTQLSTKFQLLIKTKIPTNEQILASSLSDAVFIMLTKVKIPTIVGILTFMSMINLMLN